MPPMALRQIPRQMRARISSSYLSSLDALGADATTLTVAIARTISICGGARGVMTSTAKPASSKWVSSRTAKSVTRLSALTGKIRGGACALTGAVSANSATNRIAGNVNT